MAEQSSTSTYEEKMAAYNRQIANIKAFVTQGGADNKAALLAALKAKGKERPNPRGGGGGGRG